MEEEFDDFLDKVTQVTDAIQGLKTGSVSLDEADALADAINPEKQAEKEAQRLAAEKLERQKKGRAGKGMGDDYEWFCKACFLEYQVDMEGDTCVKCQGELTRQADRVAEIRAKAKKLARAKHYRDCKRKLFAHRQHTLMEKQKAKRKGEGGAGGADGDGEEKKSNTRRKPEKLQLAATDYQSWDFWEPSSEEDSDFTPDNPQFKALEADIRMRAKARAQKLKDSLIHKKRGNLAFSKGEYKSAIKHYTKAIELKKDQKPYYTNRALCHIHLEEWPAAVKDCNTVLEIWEFLDDKKGSKQHPVVLKALLRRAAGYRGQRMYKDAREDLEEALKLCPGHVEATKLLEKTDADIAEAEREEEVLKEAGREREQRVEESAQQNESKEEEKEDDGVEGARVELIEDGDDDDADESDKVPTSTSTSKPKISPKPSDDENTEKTPFDHVEDYVNHLDALFAPASGSGDSVSEASGRDDAQPNISVCWAVSNLLAEDKYRIFFREVGGVEKELALLKRLRVRAGELHGASQGVDDDEKQSEATDRVERLQVAHLGVVSRASVNKHNQEKFAVGGGVDELFTLLRQPHSQVTRAASELLADLTEHATIREILVRTPEDTYALLSGWLQQTDHTTVEASMLVTLSNCAFESKFKKFARGPEVAAGVFALIVPFLVKSQRGRSIAVMNGALRALGNLIVDAHLRRAWVSNPAHLSLVMDLLRAAGTRGKKRKYKLDEASADLVERILALAVNCTADDASLPSLLESNPKQALDILMLGSSQTLSTTIRGAAWSFISRCIRLPKSRASFVELGGVAQALAILAVPIDASPLPMPVYESCVRSLATALSDDLGGDTQTMQTAGDKLLAWPGLGKPSDGGAATASAPAGVRAVISLVAWEGAEKDVAVGNAALVLASLARRGKQTLPQLETAGRPLCLLLKRPERLAGLRVKQNASIALARMCGHAPVLKVVRETDSMSLMAAFGRAKV